MKKHFLMALLLGIGCAAIALPCYRYFIAAPSRVDASDGTYREGVWVQWEKVNTAFAYEVYRALQPDSKKAQLLPNSGYAQNKVLDKDVRAGVLYYYWVKAISENEKSALSPHNSGFVAQVDDDVFATGENQDTLYKIIDFVSPSKTTARRKTLELNLSIYKNKNWKGSIEIQIYLCPNSSLDGKKELLWGRVLDKGAGYPIMEVIATNTNTKEWNPSIPIDAPAGKYYLIALLSSPENDVQYVRALPIEVTE